MLRNKRAYCFCGTQEYQLNLKSIETNQLDCDTKWTELPIIEKVDKVFHIGSVEFRGSILVFGGFYSKTNMYEFT